jgi:glycosyltransferase involved in cell wall biosynthesis
MVSATWPWSEFYFREGRHFRGLVSRFLEFLIFNSASVITVGTREIQENIERVLWSRKEIMPRTNYVNCEVFSAKTDYALSNPVRLIFIGRLEKQKNPFLLLESLKRLQHSRAVELTMVGEGSLKNRILQFAEENQLNVKLLGLVSYERIPGLLKTSDIFVLPSRYEGTPKAVLEAMSCGLPVVGTDVIGLASFLGEGRGLICSPHAADLCEKLSLLIDDCEMRQRIGEKARAYVLRYHTAELVMKQELEALKQLPGPAGA